MPSAPRGAATDRHSALMHSEQPETTGEIVGAQTHSEQLETTGEIVGAQTLSARREVATVLPVRQMLLEPLDAIDAGTIGAKKRHLHMGRW